MNQPCGNTENDGKTRMKRKMQNKVLLFSMNELMHEDGSS